MSMPQIIEMLAKLQASQDAYQERMDAMFEAYKKGMMATKKIEKNPGMMQSAEGHQDVPNENVTVRPVKGLRKRRRV
jgi:hypothetical protein